MSSYIEGQTHQLLDSLEAHRYTAGHLTQLGQLGERHSLVIAYLEGRAEIKMLNILRRLYADEAITICPTTGIETLANTSDVFTGYLDPNFKKWGTNVVGSPMADQSIEVHEMVQDGDFKTIFGSLGTNLDNLCLTQGQIKAFCRDHRDKLRQEGYATFFLFKVNGEFFVARVFVDGRGLHVHVSRFSFAGVCHGGCRHRIVLPQQEL